MPNSNSTEALVSLISQFRSESETNSFDRLLQFIRTKKFIPFYYNGTKFFFFVFRGNLYYINEFYFCLIISSVTFLGTFGIRKILDRFKIRHKIKNKLKDLIKTYRGGANHDEIVHFEENLDLAIERYQNDFKLINPLELTQTERYIRSIIQKCISPNRFYRITDSALAQTIINMVTKPRAINDLVNNLGKTPEAARIVSYDVFVLALVVAIKPFAPITHGGLAKLNPIPAVVIPYLPLITSMLTGLGFGLGLNLHVNLLSWSFVNQIAQWLATTTMSYNVAENFRSQFYLNCQNFVQELPRTYINYLEGPDTEKRSTALVPYTRQLPVDKDVFVSTSPGSTLYYQEDVDQQASKFSVATLDGYYRKTKNLSGDTTIRWFSNREKRNLKSSYIPLESRTKTLSDLINSDSTSERNSATRIITSLQNKQIREKLILEFPE